MKKFGHLNRDIARVLAGMGHTDSLVIADCGLPIPDGVECIDVSLALHVPRFFDVLDSVLADFKAERAVFASESLTHNAAVVARMDELATVQQQPELIGQYGVQTAKKLVDGQPVDKFIPVPLNLYKQ